MKAQPLKKTETGFTKCPIEEATHVMLNVPSSPSKLITLPVILKGKREGTHCWTWNGNTEKPTLKPSVLTVTRGSGFRCHSFINDGQAQFLSDCSHEYANKTLDLIDLEEES